MPIDAKYVKRRQLPVGKQTGISRCFAEAVYSIHTLASSIRHYSQSGMSLCINSLYNEAYITFSEPGKADKPFT